VADRVELVGTLPHEELATAYSAADVLALLSSREGWPNVLLEAMACGTPVLATRVWGSPEVVRDEAVGRLLDETGPAAVAGALEELLGHPRDPRGVRAYAEQHSWDRVADGMQEVFDAALAAGETG
jgi:glycosyltransferase involved in cell wall biosynthesis